jgi:hypothetical protein
VRVIDAILRSAREGRSIHLGWAPRKRRPESRDRMRRPKVREPETVNVEGAAAE